MQKQTKINQYAYSRQLAQYGYELQNQIMDMSAFIYGLSGVGAQVVKNLIKTGFRKVTIYDNTVASWSDLGNNIFIQQEDIGKKTRAQACLPHLRELQQNTVVSIAQSTQISAITHHTILFVIDCYDKQYLTTIDKKCRQLNIKVIVGGSLGLSGYCFVDFGEEHIITDENGEEEDEILITNITKQTQSKIELYRGYEREYLLNDGDIILIERVQGMTQVNGNTYQIKRLDPPANSIGDTSNFHPYTQRGTVKLVKQQKKMYFLDFEQSLKQFKCCETACEISNFNLIIESIYYFWSLFKRLPRIKQEKDLQLIIQWVKNTVKENKKIEEILKHIEIVSYYASLQICPICTIWGAIIAQQAVKITGKYTPIYQWCFEIYTQLIPKTKKLLNSPCIIKNDRYYAYRALFGDNFIQKCKQLNPLIVGANGITGQILKIMALMGISTAQQSEIKLLDQEKIRLFESKQFFGFKERDLYESNAQKLKQVSKYLNKDLHISLIKQDITKQMLEDLGDYFWDKLDCVICNSPKSKIKNLIDNQVVWHEKTAFFCATQGAKSSVQSIIPFKTISNSDFIDMPLSSIDLSTIVNFPFKNIHNASYGMTIFDWKFTKVVEILREFYKDRHAYLGRLRGRRRQFYFSENQEMSQILRMHFIQKSYEMFVKLGVQLFCDIFYESPLNLRRSWPQNYVCEQTGNLFWTSYRPFPQPIMLNIQDPLHFQFIYATANIYAQIFKISIPTDHSFIIKCVQQAQFEATPKFQDGRYNIQSQMLFKKLCDDLESLQIQNCIIPDSFAPDFDDPYNFHDQFMYSFVNIRGTVYKLQPINRIKTKMAATNFTSSLITGASHSAGLFGIQFIKFIQDRSQANLLNSYANLALPMFLSFEPSPPIIMADKQFDLIMCGPIRVLPKKFTKWQKMVIKGSLTLKQLIERFGQQQNVTIEMIAYNTQALFSSYKPLENRQEHLNRKIEEVIVEKRGAPIPQNVRCVCLYVSATDHSNIDCLFPDIRYCFRDYV